MRGQGGTKVLVECLEVEAQILYIDQVLAILDVAPAGKFSDLHLRNSRMKSEMAKEQPVPKYHPLHDPPWLEGASTPGFQSTLYQVHISSPEGYADAQLTIDADRLGYLNETREKKLMFTPDE